MSDRYDQLREVRARHPETIRAAAARRRRRPLLGETGRLLLIAADHPARGVLGVRQATGVMADRYRLLDRLCTALGRPGVDGVLGTPDILEDLLLLDCLDDKVVVGSMNRGGLHGAVFEADDRFTAYDAPTIAEMGFDGGKMLCRVDLADPATAGTLAACGRAVAELARYRLMALVEPFLSSRTGGRLRNDLDVEAVVRSVAIASGLAPTSAYTWLKLPVVTGMARVMTATTLPTLLLGGDPADDPARTFAAWAEALALPGVRGLVVGRSLLFPPDDDVAGAVDRAAALVHRTGS
ncbi:aldolase [Plantactinospora veratri]|uniref:Aldolase n=1 Tax=Plantactinospora veratri TaxID=1436122 RepID=A0ABU7SPQ5_9ACTN